MREETFLLPTKVTINDIQDKIKGVHYTLLDDRRTTVCQLDLENGYTILGTSACVDEKEFNVALGEKYSYEDAINKLWPLEGYLLAEKRFQRGKD